MDWRNIAIGPTDRAILIGATGCGKTTLAHYLVSDPSHPYSVVYDPKISESIGEWDDHVFFYTYSEYDKALDDPDNYPRIVYRPNMRESLDPDAQEKFFEDIYWRKNTRLYIDEAYSVLGGTSPSFHLQAILSRGRERGISCVVATQRPKRIPLVFKSEVEHMYIFRLNLMEDRLVIAQNTDIDIHELLDLQNYEFIYYNCLTGKRSRVLKLDLSGSTAKNKAA
jgi:hypothetical protein